MFGYMGDGRMMAEQVKAEVALCLEYLAENVRSLIEQGLTVTSEVKIGLAARAIIAATKAGDCIVMASHGRSGLARWYIGSVAEQVMRLAPVPVMVVRKSVPQMESSERPQVALVP
jgi:nucleotide-binding universal stress UspA family protein